MLAAQQVKQKKIKGWRGERLYLEPDGLKISVARKIRKILWQLFRKHEPGKWKSFLGIKFLLFFSTSVELNQIVIMISSHISLSKNLW